MSTPDELQYRTLNPEVKECADFLQEVMQETEEVVESLQTQERIRLRIVFALAK